MLLNLLKQKKLLSVNCASKFIMVGLSAATIYFTIFAVLWNIAHIQYAIAVTVAYVCAILFHFFANRYFTFNSHGYHLGPHAFRYITLLITNYLVTLTIVYFTVEILYLSPYFGMLFALACTPIISYLTLGLWVFNVAKKNNS